MARYAKGIIAVLAAAGVIVSSGVLGETAELWVNVIIAALGAALVVLVPNAELPPRAKAPPVRETPPSEPPTSPTV